MNLLVLAARVATTTVGYPFAWVHMKFIDRQAVPAGMLYSIALGTLSLVYGVVVWLLLALGLTGYGIYRAISG